ncbi:hypothetical protein D3C80_1369260 [compost metagenome]
MVFVTRCKLLQNASFVAGFVMSADFQLLFSDNNLDLNFVIVLEDIRFRIFRSLNLLLYALLEQFLEIRQNLLKPHRHIVLIRQLKLRNHYFDIILLV